MSSSEEQWAIAGHLVERRSDGDMWRDIVKKLLREVECYLAFWEAAAAEQR
jgi:hypothetical protein